jgi:hypothetical protein
LSALNKKLSMPKPQRPKPPIQTRPTLAKSVGGLPLPPKLAKPPSPRVMKPLLAAPPKQSVSKPQPPRPNKPAQMRGGQSSVAGKLGSFNPNGKKRR